MVRVALTAYLTLAASLGPGLCWCTALQATSPICCHDKQPLVPEEKTHSHATCHGHSHHAAQNDEADHHGDGNKSPCPSEKPACPCDHHQAIPVALLASDGNFRTQSVELGPALERMVVLDLSHAAVIVSASDFSERFYHSLSTPYASGREILRALHILRC